MPLGAQTFCSMSFTGLEALVWKLKLNSFSSGSFVFIAELVSLISTGGFAWYWAGAELNADHASKRSWAPRGVPCCAWGEAFLSSGALIS